MANPAAREIRTAGAALRTFTGSKVRGRRWSTSMITITVSDSTSSCVSATSGAPRERICTVIRMPTADRATVAPSRERATQTPITEAAISTSSTTSIGWVRPGVWGARASVATRVATPASTTTARDPTIIPAWGPAASEAVRRATPRPARSAPVVMDSRIEAPLNGRVRCSRAGHRRRRVAMVTAPRANTARVVSSSGVIPCQSTKCGCGSVAGSAAPVAVPTTVSNSGSTKTAATETRIGRPAMPTRTGPGACRCVASSGRLVFWSSGVRRAGSRKPPTTILAQ